MVKTIRSLLLHILIILFRRLFNFLCKRLDIWYDEDENPCWSDSYCGIYECIFDKE